MPNPALIETKNLTIRFPVGGTLLAPQWIVPVNQVNLTIAAGEVLALVGESGSGKTTVGRALARILQPSAGDITYRNKSVGRIKGRHLETYHSQVQMIFQDPFASLNPVHTIVEHLRFPLRKHRGIARAHVYEEVLQLLETVGLTPARDIMDKYPHELSGGQRQRVAIARALAVNPEFIVADEPISMLDVSIRAGVLRLLNELRQRLDLAFLYITHDLASARYFADRIAVMYGGRIVELTSARELVRRPEHPYSRLLLASTPGQDLGLTVFPTKQVAPDLSSTRVGCGFVERCPWAVDPCHTDEPALQRRDDGADGSAHWVACHRSMSEIGGDHA